MSIFKEKKNCWRFSEIARGAFLVDADAYFRALHAAFLEAKESIFIVGWDIDSRIPLIPEKIDRRVPIELGALLRYLIRKNHHLQVYILVWDFYPIFALEREFLMRFNLGWSTPGRIHFVLDNEYPIGASQHQKFVVVDDQIAFSGGLDITSSRWDTPEHLPDDPRRVNPNGKAYEPFHDVQMMIAGKAARSLGRLARKRWHRATGENLPASKLLLNDGRFDHLPWELEVAPLAISRTEPRYKNFPEIREVEQLFIDLIRSAKQHIYIENQYFTSQLVCRELVRSLRQRTGPEITVVLPSEPTGWLEQKTMGVLRTILLQKIRKADRFGRLGVFSPAWHNSKVPINLHSKVLIVDDRYVRIGSANLSNRSMGLDSECDLTLDASSDNDLQAKVQEFKARLLAEHTGQRAEEVLTVLKRGKSPNSFIRNCRNDRFLRPFSPKTKVSPDDLLISADWLDLEKPLAADQIFDSIGPYFNLQSSWLFRNKTFLLGSIAGGLLALLFFWIYRGEYLALPDFAKAFQSITWSYQAILGVYALGGMLFFPLSLLIFITALLFPAGLALFYILTGTMLHASVSYLLGRGLGKRMARRLFYRRVHVFARKLTQKGILPILLIRLVPIAPFAIINFIAGAFRVPFHSFIFGTLLGILPLAFLLLLFGKALLLVIEQPNPLSIGLFLVIFGSIFWAVRQIRQRLTAFSTEFASGRSAK